MATLTLQEILMIIGNKEIEIACRDKDIVILQTRNMELEAKIKELEPKSKSKDGPK